MRLISYAACLIGVLLIQTASSDKPEWSWGNDDSEPSETTVLDQPTNETTAVEDDVLDSIISSGRQGRTIDGLDELYSDPNVKEALQKGDNREARNVIKERLCSLGLMQVLTHF